MSRMSVYDGDYSTMSVTGGDTENSSDRTSLLQAELIQSASRERQLQQQLDKAKQDILRLETVQKEFDDLKERDSKYDYCYDD